MKSLLAKTCCLLLLFAALLACRLGGGLGDDGSKRTTREKGGRNAELCKKFESCGCQSYDDCMAQAEKSEDLEKPGVRECMLNSSCESLCAGKPDGCGGSTSSGQGDTTPKKSDCSHIRCSKDSDCPSDCYGGCDGVICYSF